MNLSVHPVNTPTSSSQIVDDHVVTETVAQVIQTELRPMIEVFLICGVQKKIVTVDPAVNQTVESLMHHLYTEHRNILGSKSIYDYEFYIANKRGEPKDDYPAVDKQQQLTLIKFNRFVMTSRDHLNGSLSKIKEYLDETETVCFCFKRKIKLGEDYQRIN